MTSPLRASPAWVAALAAVLALGWIASSEPASAQSISPDAKTAADVVLRAHRAERQRSTPLIELGRALRDVRVAARDVMITAPSGGGAGTARLLEAAVQRAQDLLDEAASEASGPGAAHLQLVQDRLDQLATRTTAIVDASRETDRAAGARLLLEDLEVRHGARNRLLGGPIRVPSFGLAAPHAASETRR